MPEFIKTYQQAEANAAAHLRGFGYDDARVLPDGADGGIDVVASEAIAQVKWKGAQVSRPDLQRLYGARGLDTHKVLFFFCASGYTQHAVQYADDVKMELYTYDPDGSVLPINEVAREGLARRREAVETLRRGDELAAARHQEEMYGARVSDRVVIEIVVPAWSEWNPTTHERITKFLKDASQIQDLDPASPSIYMPLDLPTKAIQNTTCSKPEFVVKPWHLKQRRRKHR